MKCSNARELINAYIDNGIDPSNDRLLQDHLAVCPECRAELDFLQSYRKILSGIRPVKAPAGFMHELRRRLEADRKNPFRKYIDAFMDYISSIHFPVEAAALVIIGSVIFALYRPDRFFTQKMTVPVSEYSENATTGKFSPAAKETAPRTDTLSRKSRDYYKPALESEKADDEFAAVNREKDKSGMSFDRSETGEMQRSVKKESAGAEDLASSAEKESSLFMNEERAPDTRKAENHEGRVMGKQRLDAARDMTVKNICGRYGAVIVKTKKINSGTVEYTIKVIENQTGPLLEELRGNSSVIQKSIVVRDGYSNIILEINEK